MEGALLLQSCLLSLGMGESEGPHSSFCPWGVGGLRGVQGSEPRSPLTSSRASTGPAAAHPSASPCFPSELQTLVTSERWLLASHHPHMALGSRSDVWGDLGVTSRLVWRSSE